MKDLRREAEERTLQLWREIMRLHQEGFVAGGRVDSAAYVAAQHEAQRRIAAALLDFAGRVLEHAGGSLPRVRQG